MPTASSSATPSCSSTTPTRRPRSTPRWSRSTRLSTDTREHAGDEVAEQVDEQADALNRAADGFVGANTTDDAFEADLYQAELDVALDDLSSQASDFRAQGPEVHQAFWEGVDESLSNG